VEVGRLDEALEADEPEFFELHLSSRGGRGRGRRIT
jgi:hypothetical protein